MIYLAIFIEFYTFCSKIHNFQDFFKILFLPEKYVYWGFIGAFEAVFKHFFYSESVLKVRENQKNLPQKTKNRANFQTTKWKGKNCPSSKIQKLVKNYNSLVIRIGLTFKIRKFLREVFPRQREDQIAGTSCIRAAALVFFGIFWFSGHISVIRLWPNTYQN